MISREENLSGTNGGKTDENTAAFPSVSPPGVHAGADVVCAAGASASPCSPGILSSQTTIFPTPAKWSAQNLHASKTEGNWRMLLSAYQALRADQPKISYPEAAALMGTDAATLWRVVNVYSKRELKAGYANCGRTSGFAILLKDKNFTAKLDDIYLATIGASGQNVVNGRRTARMATALTCMAEEPECPAALATKLRQGKFPSCLKRHLKRITPEMENRLRGAKHFQLNGITSRRDLTVRFPDGSRGDMPAGFKWVFDDMSVNQPFWFNTDGQMLFSRQGLYAIDHRSLRWLGKMLIARPREAYRAEDILRFLRGLFKAYKGRPDVIVFERGIWHARKIRGFKITNTGAFVDDEFERPEMEDSEKHLLTDGLSAIGVQIIFATSAHGKIIETCFNPLQALIAVQTREYVNIGRHAGEFEIPGKRLAQVRAGSRAPGEVGFVPMEILDERINKVFAQKNASVNSRNEVPDEIWSRDIEARPLTEVKPEDFAVFLPEVRKTQINGGCVTIRVQGKDHDFRAAQMIELGGGYKVHIRFDPAEPQLGAAIYNREIGDNNFLQKQDGEFICFAAWEMPAPSVNVAADVRGIVPQSVEEIYGAGAVDQGDAIRRKQERLVATTFSALPRPGQPAIKSIEARDGDGRLARRSNSETQSTQPVAEPLPRSRNMLAQSTPEEFARRRARLKNEASQARVLLNQT